MQASQSQMNDLHYLLQPDFCHYPCDSHQSQNFTNQFYYSITSPQGQEKWQGSIPNLASLSSNSTTTDEAEVSITLTNERKQRRMISNRESARRSRLLKQRLLDELWSQVVWLRNENHQLVDSLNDALENRDRLAEENAQLRHEVSDLRKMLLNS